MKMRALCFTVLLYITCLIQFTQVLAKTTESISYDEINRLLTKYVKNSIDPITNLAKLKEWREGGGGWLLGDKPIAICQMYDEYKNHDDYQRSQNFRNIGEINDWDKYKSFCETLNELIVLPDLVADKTMCSEDYLNRVIKYDYYLKKARSYMGGNVPYGRVDRILEHFAFNWADSCQSSLVKRPQLSYIFKTRAYDEINEFLVYNVTSDNLTENMAKLDEKLDNLISDQVEEGVLADALRQLRAMKSVGDEKMCNSKGYEIVLKNDLATGGSAHTNKLAPVRRIDKLVRHYSLQHANVCSTKYEPKFEALVKKLNTTTRDQLLTLASTYLPVDGIENTTFYAFSPELFTPELFTYFEPNSTNFKEFGKFTSRSHISSLLKPEMIRKYLEKVAINDTDIVYLKRVPDEITGEFVVYDDITRSLFNQYLLRPCQHYVDILGREVFRFLKYDEQVMDISRNPAVSITSPSFVVGRITYEVCRFVDENSQTLIKSISDSFPFLPGRSSIKDIEYPDPNLSKSTS